MYIPSSTYRIQFNKDFTFKDLLNIMDYLHELGISTLYASPILKSTSGSTHGYDVTDPHSLDPEIGSIGDLQAIVGRLKQRGMSWLQDIVPNHMAFDTSNFRLMDVLERGPHSTYYNYFDIIWNHPDPEIHNKLWVPFLGDDLEVCVENRQVQISLSEEGFVVKYFNAYYPVSVSAYDFLFSISNSEMTQALRKAWGEFITNPASQSDYSHWSTHKKKWARKLNSATNQATINEIISTINNDKEIMLKLLEKQYYVLAHWKQTEKKINYRRFFTINQLICLRMEEEFVFNEYHRFLYTLFNDKWIQGLRIDHIDGLQDPSQYIQNLRSLFGESCYIIAEKILEAKEDMPARWPLQGTSGYEFLAYVNQLFTDRKGAKQLLKFYQELVPDLPPYNQLVFENKKRMLENYMAGEWDNLIHYFFELNLQENFEALKLRQALGLIMISLPVYRIYPDSIPLKGKDLVIIRETFDKARQQGLTCKAEIDYLYSLLVSPSDQHAEILSFFKRLMQFTGPLTAKGVEDTTFYIYNPLISHDEVGDSPSTLGITTSEFHGRMAARQLTTPLSLNATATHDTKRGEDVRIRLNVLSELPEEWQAVVKEWFVMNKRFHARVEDTMAPGVNDEYFIYQSIVGGFPEDFIVTDSWIKRLQDYLVKVVREAKVKSNWESPNESYENTCTQFVEKILKEEREFLPSILSFVKKVCAYANTNALGQVLIKITAPGIPDIYQGCELWDLSFVDPDNRRPVDYAIRKNYLDQIKKKEREGPEALFSFLRQHRGAGMEKLFVTWKALNFRKNNELIFREGTYLRLQVTGSDELAMVYARHYNDQWILIVISLGTAKRDEMEKFPKQEAASAAIVLLEQLPQQWTNDFTGKKLTATNGLLTLQEILEDFPVALFHNIKFPSPI